MEALVLRHVAKYLGLVVKNFTREQAKLSLLRGRAALRDLELDHDFFNNLIAATLPTFGLGKLTCTQISLDVPWTRFKHEPITIKLGHVEALIIEQSDNSILSKSSELMSNIDVTASNDGSITSNTKSDTDSTAKSGHYGFLEKVIDGIRVQFDELIIRIQLLGVSSETIVGDLDTEHTTKMLQIVLTEGEFFQTDPNGNVVSLKQARSHFEKEPFKTIHKMFTCQRLRVSIVNVDSSCQITNLFDVIDITPLYLHIKLRRHDSGDLERVLCSLNMPILMMDLSSTQTTIFLTEIIALINAMWREDPRISEEMRHSSRHDRQSESGNPLAKATSNDTLIAAYNEMRMGESTRLFESHNLCALPPLDSGRFVFSLSIDRVVLSVHGETAIVPSQQKIVSDVCFEAHGLALSTISYLNANNASLWPERLPSTISEIIASVVMQFIEIRVNDDIILSSKPGLIFWPHTPTLDEPLAHINSKTAINIKMTSRWPRPFPPLLGSHTDIRINLMSVCADAGLWIEAISTVIAIPVAEAFNCLCKLHPEANNVQTLTRVEVNGTHITLPGPDITTQSEVNEFVASIGTFRLCIGPHLSSSAHRRGLVTADEQETIQAIAKDEAEAISKHDVEVYLNAAELHAILSPMANNAVKGTVLELLRVETLRFFSMTSQVDEQQHNNDSLVVEKLSFGVFTELAPAIQAITNTVHSAVTQCELFKHNNKSTAKNIITSHTNPRPMNAVSPYRIAARIGCLCIVKHSFTNTDEITEVVARAKASETQLIVDIVGLCSNVSVECDKLELEDATSTSSTPATWLKPFAKFTLDEYNGGKRILFEAVQMGERTDIQGQNTKLRSFSLREFRHELLEMSSALQSFVHADDNACFSASRGISGVPRHHIISPSTRLAVLRFSDEMKTNHDTLVSPMHAAKMSEATFFVPAGQEKLTNNIENESIDIRGCFSPNMKKMQARLSKLNVFEFDELSAKSSNKSMNLHSYDEPKSSTKQELKEHNVEKEMNENVLLNESRLLVGRLTVRNRMLKTQLQMQNSRLVVALDSLEKERERAKAEKTQIIEGYGEIQNSMQCEITQLYEKIASLSSMLTNRNKIHSDL